METITWSHMLLEDAKYYNKTNNSVSLDFCRIYSTEQSTKNILAEGYVGSDATRISLVDKEESPECRIVWGLSQTILSYKLMRLITRGGAIEWEGARISTVLGRVSVEFRSSDPLHDQNKLTADLSRANQTLWEVVQLWRPPQGELCTAFMFTV